MRITCLGTGAWGSALAALLTNKGHNVRCWGRDSGSPREAVADAQLIVESVTSQGIRPVFEELQGYLPPVPVVLTSKGIEQHTGLTLSDLVCSIVGKHPIAVLSGPSFASEVRQGLPTAVVVGADPKVAPIVIDAFTTNSFRVYPNSDMRGVSYGGALKNIIAIACGVADGMQLGNGARAALMTRGLHEMVKLARTQGCKIETLYGLSGMGDLFLTCSSTLSRNYRFGALLSQGYTVERAKQEIHMVVEGAYAAISALEIAQANHLALPITEAVHAIITGTLTPTNAVAALMQRPIKEEHL